MQSKHLSLYGYILVIENAKVQVIENAKVQVLTYVRF